MFPDAPSWVMRLEFAASRSFFLPTSVCDLQPSSLRAAGFSLQLCVGGLDIERLKRALSRTHFHVKSSAACFYL